VRDVDNAIHSLDDEFEKVNQIGSKLKIDRKSAEKALKLMSQRLKG
jgi:hypothetical protein